MDINYIPTSFRKIQRHVLTSCLWIGIASFTKHRVSYILRKAYSYKDREGTTNLTEDNVHINKSNVVHKKCAHIYMWIASNILSKTFLIPPTIIWVIPSICYTLYVEILLTLYRNIILVNIVNYKLSVKILLTWYIICFILVD